MSKHNKHLIQDLILLAISIGCAIFLLETGILSRLVLSLDGLGWLGIIVAGMFFTSVFTTAPSIALLATFAETTSLPALALLGGFGAVLGDYVIFRFVKDRMAEDVAHLLSLSRRKRIAAVFRRRFFRFFVPFVAALVIASPLPDEIGIALLGATKARDRVFFALSFIANSSGVFVIGWIAKDLLGL